MGKWHREPAGSGSKYRRFGTFKTREDGSETLVIYARESPEAWIQSDTFGVGVDAPAQPAEDG